LWSEIRGSDFCDHGRLEIALQEIRLATAGEFGWFGGSLIGCLGALARHQFLVIVPQDLNILPGHDEVLLLHALALVPVDERTFAEHEVELLAQPRPRACYGRRVGHHAHSSATTHQLVIGGQFEHGRPAVDAHFEPGRTPLYELQALGGPDLLYGLVDVLSHHIAAVQHATRYVLAFGVLFFAQLEQLIAGLETRGRQVYDGWTLVSGLLGRCEWRVSQ